MAQYNQADVRTERLQQVLAASHAQGGFNGSVLIAEGERVLLRMAFGDDARGVPIQPSDRFMIASVTKQLAAVLVMQLVGEGRIELDAPVERYLTAWKPATAEPVTIRHLLLHRSGLPQPGVGRPDAGCDLEDVIVGLRGRTLSTPAGTRFRYNNVDYRVLEAVIEAVTGRPFARVLHDRIVRPLGLRNTGMARPDVSVDSLADPGPPPAGEQFPCYGAAGASYATIDDLWVFDRALLDGRLLMPALRDTLWASDSGQGYVAMGAWSYPRPTAGGPPVTVIERQGGIGRAEALNVIVPEHGVVMVLLKTGGEASLFDLSYAPGLPDALLRIVLEGTGK